MKNKDKEHSSSGGKVAVFFKKNIYIVLMIACVLAIVTMITVAAVINANPKVDEGGPTVNVPPDNSKPVEKPDEGGDPVEKPDDITPEFVFIMQSPIAKTTGEGIGFSGVDVVFNPTQGDWSTHDGMDMMATAGSAVVCGFDGVVKSVTEDCYYGAVVVVKHNGGFESTYKLLQNAKVKVGDTVKKGSAIGEVSGSAYYEIAQGAHLHLELTKDGTKVNPMTYMTEGNK